MLTYFHKLIIWIKRNLSDVIFFGIICLILAFMFYAALTCPSPEEQAILEVENRLENIERKLDSIEKKL